MQKKKKKKEKMDVEQPIHTSSSSLSFTKLSECKALNEMTYDVSFYGNFKRKSYTSLFLRLFE